MSELEQLTPETYLVPKGEEMVYHVKQEIVQYDRNTGRKLFTPRIQKYGRKEFEGGLYENLLKQGYQVVILHDPKKWIAEHQEAVAAAAKKAAEEKAAKEKAAFDKAVAEAVKKQLEGLNISSQKKPSGK